MKTFEDVLGDAGFDLKGMIIADGEVHRFRHVSNNSSKEPMWAILFPDGKAGVYGDWREGDNNFWHVDGKSFHQLEPIDREARKLQKAQAEIKTNAIREQAASLAVNTWESLTDGGQSKYIEEKCVGAYGIKIDKKGDVYIPLRDVHGRIWNIQRIIWNKETKRGDKWFNADARKKGCFHLIEGNTDKIVLCEGYATGASIHEATGLKVVVCFDSGNMVTVAGELKTAGWKNMIVAADNDSERKDSGKKKAEKIKAEFGISYVMPEVPGDFNDLAASGVDITGYFFETVEAYSIGDYIADKSPMPEDLISPRILTDAGVLFFGGAPKVGKSDFMLSWLMHMAAGSEFMKMKPARPLRIFYLQAEIGYHYIRERIKMVDIDRELLGLVEKNMVVTPRLRMLLDADGVDKVGNTIRKMGDVDIIAIDPMRNLYDGESENDNMQMTSFLQNRVEALRRYAKPTTGIVVVHHTKKISKEDLAIDPFLCFSGASALRGFYNTGMMMYRPDEDVSERVLAFEVRDGKPVDKVHIDKMQGRWYIIPKEQQRIAHEGQGKRNDMERERKIITLKDALGDEFDNGNYYTKQAFAEFMAGKNDLGSSDTIKRLLGEMLAQGDINIFKQENSNKNLLCL